MEGEKMNKELKVFKFFSTKKLIYTSSMEKDMTCPRSEEENLILQSNIIFVLYCESNFMLSNIRISSK